MVTGLNIEAAIEDKNPYVGPQPMRAGDPIFGRDREITALRHFIAAERIVLLHSPSGAGKSSLVSAGLIPKLQDRFEIWGPTRVNQMPPVSGVSNRFTWSSISGFEQSLRKDAEAGVTAAHLVQLPETLANLTLSQYVAQRERIKSPLLIFDQFEEVLRVDPVDTKTKEDFFSQLGELLADSRIWALFIMREDYLAPIDPYVRLVPTHFMNRYRIDRLKRDMATEAIVRPTENLRRKYDPAAVEQLVNNLATVRAQQLDGSFEDVIGEYVEPLQLQVVCYDIWSRKAPADLLIGPDDVGKNITGALRNYYDHALKAVSGENEQREREIREWFQFMLITPDGVRSQVRQERDRSGGLDNQLVAQLLDSYLVRAEPRGFTNWYELAHDRLIAPVRESNAKWLDERLSKLQKVAALWDKEKRSPGLLVQGKDLRDVKKWAAANPSSVHPIEKDFLAACAKKQRKIWVDYGIRVLIAGLAVSLWFSREAALNEQHKADVVFGRLFKRKAAELLDQARDQPSPEKLAASWIYATASMSLTSVPVPESAGRLLQPETMPNQPATGEECLKPDSGDCAEISLAALTNNGSQIVYSGLSGQSIDCFGCKLSTGNTGERVTALSADDRGRLAFGIESGKLRIHGGKSIVVGSKITALSYGLGPWLAAGTEQGQVLLFSDSDLTRIASVDCPDCGPVRALAWRDDSTFAAAYGNSKIRIFKRDASISASGEIAARAANAMFTSIAFWPGTNFIATGRTDGVVRIWDTESGLELARAKIHDAPVLSVAFNPIADQLVTVSADGDIHKTSLSPELFDRVWPLKNLLPAASGFTLRRELDQVSRRMLGYTNSKEEPEAGPGTPAQARRFFPLRTVVHRD